MQWLQAVAVSLSSIAVLLTVWSQPTLAAGAAKCDAFTQLSDEAYRDFRAWKCDVNLSDPRWKWPPGKDYNYRRFCIGALDETVDAIMHDIQETINRCRICSARQEQYESQDRLARKYHCGALSPGHADLFDRDKQSLGFCMFRADEIARGGYLGVEETAVDQEQKDDLTARNDQLDACMASKKNQIDFCNNYVDRTRDAAKTIASKCDFHYDDQRYLATDDVRFDWCMGLSSNPGDFKTNGQDPVQFLDNVLAGCRGMERLKTPSGVLKARTNTGSKKFGGGSQIEPGGAGLSSRNAGTGGGNAARSTGGPGLLENDQGGGFASQAPAASGPAVAPARSAPAMLDR